MAAGTLSWTYVGLAFPSFCIVRITLASLPSPVSLSPRRQISCLGPPGVPGIRPSPPEPTEPSSLVKRGILSPFPDPTLLATRWTAIQATVGEEVSGGRGSFPLCYKSLGNFFYSRLVFPDAHYYMGPPSRVDGEVVKSRRRLLSMEKGKSVAVIAPPSRVDEFGDLNVPAFSLCISS